ncbi:MAG: carbon storage regulator [Thermoguttaceae bacterium]
MLVLTRKKGQRVVIGRNIEVTVLRVQGSHVKLGVAGPTEVSIRRGEIAGARAAASPPGGTV